MTAAKRILIAPLNWGLGHATRCIPLVYRYLSEGWEVTLASDGHARVLLQAEFPLLECHDLPGYGVKYPKNGTAMVASMISQLPRLTARVNQEKKWLDSFLKQHPQDLILSDSRYGLHSSKVKSVVICHQLNIISPRMEGMVRTLHSRLLNRFDECWIPDDKDHSLSGELSKLPLRIPVKMIGPLTRLTFSAKEAKKIPVLAVVSGPEPQRGYLEETLIPVLAQIEGAILIRGVMDDHETRKIAGLTIKGHVLSDEMSRLMNAAKIVVCRSGYSSIMDLVALQKSAILIPTPGQTEQEYLAEHAIHHGVFRSLTQQSVSTDLLAMMT